MTMTAQTVDLYWETRGGGPAVLLIPATPGDGRQFAATAAALADDHLVITYDRRGTSRSGAPEGWSATTVGEQADDAATVLRQVGVDRAVVYGTSNGAAVALEVALRHPRLVRGVVLHEMPLLSVLADPASVGELIGGVVGPAMSAGGPRAALEAFLRFAWGDAVVDAWTPDVREAFLANAGMVFSIELPAFQAYRPDDAALAASTAPAAILVGRDQQAPFFAEAAEWLAARLGTTVERSPGGHGSQFTHPQELAETIRRLAAR
jgi:pimeloyl-ACP methyl ester carboxylesterase